MGFGANDGGGFPVNSPDNKKKKKDDWNYLKQTLRSNNQMGNAGQEEN